MLIAMCGWMCSTASVAQSWNITGNSGTKTSTNYIGTSDNQALIFKTNKAERIRILAGGKCEHSAYPHFAKAGCRR